MDLWTTYWPTLQNYAVRLTKNEDDAKDLVQEVAYKVLKYNVLDKSYEEQVKICKATLYYTFMDSLNLRKKLAIRHRKYSFPLVQQTPCTTELKEVLKSLDGVNKKMKVAVLAFAYGYSVKEISQATGESYTNTLTLIRRGRIAIKRSYGNEKNI
ncbi:RNA polymerase sigma factor [Segetibacter aerophilus]|uniref:DNA-directed RNA polymerase sigma-70 factor n=1 Tax=Segetibacter aerophilus TaxID=670293 RepID=A0A512B9Z2_9BACT|nr:sigma-70 family RNA polymerase sigma factor [Segetibacter aerophilus]GEO08784.1 hypothetical protein SAE01_12800 [Segetibacter aerophilus]